MTVSPSPIDMASLHACKQWIGTVSGTSQDANIQACLTAASLWFVRETGRGPRDWQTFTQNPYNQPVNYSEVYDGIYGVKLFTRNFPINSISSLVVGTYTVQASNSPNTPGYVVDDQGRAIDIIIGGAGQGYGFARGWAGPYRGGSPWRPLASGPQSIALAYNAGFNSIPVVNELDTVVAGWQANTAYANGAIVSDGVYLQQAQGSGTSGATAPAFSQQTAGVAPDGGGTFNWVNTGETAAPNTITIQNQTNTLSDQGVAYFSSGTALTKVNISPTVGQYFLVSPGNYLFNAADAGRQMLVSYTSAGTPQDIVLAIMQMVALNYLRRNWVGVRSVAMKDVGSTSYTLLLDPMIRETIFRYARASFSP